MTIPSATSAFPTLVGHEFMNLTTFRKNGIGVITTVWFAERDGKLYVTTQAGAGKAKRIRGTAHVTVGPSGMRGEPIGPVVDAQARILPEGEFALASQTLLDKYGQPYSDALSRSPSATRVFIEVTPTA